MSTDQSYFTIKWALHAISQLSEGIKFVLIAVDNSNSLL